jgi:hypothetical protein
VRIEARVFIGSNLLSVEEGRGQIQVRMDPALRDFGERRANEVAAGRAAGVIAQRVDAALSALTRDRIARLVGDDRGTSSFVLVEPPLRVPAAAPVVAPALPAPTPAAAPPLAQTQQPPPPAAPVAAPPAVAGRSWLLDVGIGDYPAGGPGDLPGPPTDVRNIRSALLGRGFANENVIELLDARATAAAVFQALDKLATQVGPNDLVVFFLSSHGAPPRDYGEAGVSRPVFYDFDDRKNPPDFRQLLDRFAQLPARNLVLLIDTCFSGGAANQLNLVVAGGSIEVRPVRTAPDLRQLTKSLKSTANFAVITASKPDEVSLDLGEEVGGLFASKFINGLQAATKSDSLQKVFEGNVFNEVVDYSSRACAEALRRGWRPCHNPQQTPTFMYSGSGNLIRLLGDGQ